MDFFKNTIFILLLMLSVTSNSFGNDKNPEQLIEKFNLLKEKANNDNGSDTFNKNSEKHFSEDITTDKPKLASNYKKVDCGKLSDPIIVSLGLFGNDTVECGQVTVPADWSAKNKDMIELAVYRIPSTSPTPAPDPVVYLAGGPGGSGVSQIPNFTIGRASYLLDRSDVVIIDQRGTGYSEPDLYCPEVFKATETSNEINDSLAKHKACHDRLVAEGIRFADYNSAYNAQDVNAVREALGYTEWNLYGVSYGTRLALTVMRDLPVGIRSVVLDSVFPVDINEMGADTPYSVYWAIEQISTNCAADADCSKNVGNVKGLIEDGVARLSTAQNSDLQFDGLMIYKAALQEFIANPHLVTKFISKVATGTDAEVRELLKQANLLINKKLGSPVNLNKAPPVLYPFANILAQGMFNAVICGEEKPYLNLSATPNIAANFRESTQRLINQVGLDASLICDIYTVPARNDIETKPVQSDLPTLVLAGNADARTPPTFAIHATETLSNSQYAEFEGFGHGLLGQDQCINQITLDFLNNPNLAANQSCISSLPKVDYITGTQ